MEEIKKAIIPISTFNSKFLPLSRIFPKAAFPVGAKPIIHYLLEEIKASEINEVIFILDSSKNPILEYFKNTKELETILRKNHREDVVKDLEDLNKLVKDLKITNIFQKKAISSAHAILQAAEKSSLGPTAVLYADYLIDSQEPCTSQLIKIFKTSQRPILGLSRIGKERIKDSKTVNIDQIAKRVFKIKQINIENPKASSDLAIIGRYIFTQEFFDYLKKEKSKLKENLTIFDAFNRMIADGKSIYGYEFEGTMLECDNKYNWIKANLYYSIKDPKYGPEIKNFIKENKLI